MTRYQRTLGKYTIDGLLGEGGMATVHQARFRDLDGTVKNVALKQLKPQPHTDPELVLHFMQEAELAFRFDHPNLVRVLDYGQLEGRYFMAMELLAGLDLEEITVRLASMPMATMPVGVAISLVRQLCDGLGSVHRGQDRNGTPVSVTHCDIAPSNLFVTSSGRLKILDFGIAERADARVIQKERVRGTPRYMSPEALRGDVVDGRSDIYSAGVVLYELLAGRHLFAGPRRDAALMLPSRLNPNCPVALDAVILRAIAPDRERRFQTARDFGAALERHGNGCYCTEDTVRRWLLDLSSNAPATTESALPSTTDIDVTEVDSVPVLAVPTFLTPEAQITGVTERHETNKAKRSPARGTRAPTSRH